MLRVFVFLLDVEDSLHGFGLVPGVAFHSRLVFRSLLSLLHVFINVLLDHLFKILSEGSAIE